MRNIVIALLAALTLAAGPAPAGHRLFKAFDFEERQLGNDEDVPMHWFKLAGAGLPHYVVGQFATDRARSGRYSFRMDLNGGSCAYQYEPDRLPVAIGGHYRLSGYCQTSLLKHARARLTLALADGTGTLLPGTEVRSETYASPTDDPTAWHALSAELTDDDPDASFLIVRMELLQQSRYAPATLGDRSLFPEDIRGSAWFDDLVVAQVPRVSLSSDRPANVFRRSDPPQLSAVLADPSKDDLASQLIVTDADGRQVYQQTGTVDLASAPVAGPGRRRVTVQLPYVPAGWYRATLRLATPGNATSPDDTAAFTGSQSLDYVQLADDAAPARPDPRFGMVIGLPPNPNLADVLPILGAGRVKIGVSDEVNGTLDRLESRGIVPVGILPLDTADPTALIARHLGQIDRWQLGADGTEAFVAPAPGARQIYGRTLTAFGALTGHPDLSMPIPMGFDPPAGKSAPVAVAMSVPPSILPSEIPPYLKDLTDRAEKGGPRVASVSLQPITADRIVVVATDWVQRVVYTLSTGVERVDVPAPLAADAPAPLFPVERTLITALSGAACRGRLPIADGVEAFLFERNDPGPGDHGVVVLWATAGEQTVALHLGEQLQSTDLWGNTTPLTGSGDGVTTLRVGTTPTILTGVDAPLARFRASVTLDAPTLESVSLTPQVRHLHLANPYAQPIAGTVRLRGPSGWTLSPPSVPFELNPGESMDRDIGIALPTNARAGRNIVRADVELQADRARPMSLPLAMAVGLNDVGVQSTAFRDGPASIVVQQRITNYGDKPVDYTAYVSAPGQPRVERLVTGLVPGRTVLKRYRFPVTDDGEIRLKTGLKETDGPRVLNEELTVR